MLCLKYIILATLLISSTVSASDNTTTTKEIWGSLLISSLPSAFCAPDQYFSQCSKLSNKDCKDFIEFSVKTCLEIRDSEIPKTISKVLGTKWGDIIGRCTENLMENALVKTNRKVNSKECNRTTGHVM